MKNKQTPVQWLHLEFQKRFPKQTSEMYENNQLDYEDMIIKAKAMEKEQIIDAWNDGYEKGLRVREEKIINPVFDAETYYDDTYGK